MDDTELRAILQKAETIAVYGMSRSRHKAAHRVPARMVEAGFEVIPVNPYADEIMGRTCYDSLMAVPERIDIVDVFRPSAEALAVVEEAVTRHKERGDVALIWLQAGIRNEAARALAEEAEIPFVQDRCMAVEVPRLLPEKA